MGSGPTTRSRSALRSTPHLDHRPGPQPRSEGQVQQLGTSSNSQTAEAEAAESAYLRTALHNAINACDRPAINRFRRTLEPSIFEILVRASSASNRIKSRVLTDGLYPHEEKYLEGKDASQTAGVKLPHPRRTLKRPTLPLPRLSPRLRRRQTRSQQRARYHTPRLPRRSRQSLAIRLSPPRTTQTNQRPSQWTT